MTSSQDDATDRCGGGGDWRPIETAPRDGTDYLAWFSVPDIADGGVIDHVYWDDSFGPHDFKGAFVFAGEGSRCARPPGLYTHWQPLPSPPASPAPPEGGLMLGGNVSRNQPRMRGENAATPTALPVGKEGR